MKKQIQRLDYVPEGSYCSNCKHKKEELTTGMSGNLRPVWVCQSVYCRDPVTGDQVTCSISRQQQVLCGVDGRYFEEQSTLEAAPVIELVSK